MKYLFDGYNYILRLDKGERLSDAMRAFFAAEPQVTGAVSAIGGAQEVTLGFYDLPARQYRWQTFNKLYEITAMQGTIAFGEDGKQMYHLHGTFGDEQYQVIGGHVKDLIVGGTCEIFVHRAYQPLHRSTDPEVGLQTLAL